MPKNQQPKLIWSVESLSDVTRLREFIEPHNKSAAKNVAATLKKSAILLLDYPLIGKSIEDRNEHEFPIKLGRKRYVIRYKISGSKIVILRIWHSLEDR